MNRLRTIRRTGPDSGLSLPELLITMVLVGVLGTIILTLVSSMFRTFTRDRSATESITIAATGMNEMTRVIRSGTEVPITGGQAPVVVAAEDEMLVLHAYLDTDSMNPEPIMVRFTVEGDRDLVEDRWNATATGPQTWSFPLPTATPAVSRVVARKISPVAAEPVFQYYDSLTSATPMTVPVGGFTEEQRRTIVRIEVYLSVQADLTARAEPVVLNNTVGIPNLGINVMGAATP